MSPPEEHRMCRSSILIGGAPITTETYGGHYTGTDAERNKKAAMPSEPLSPEAIVLERASASERETFLRSEKVVSILATVMGLMMLLTLGVFLTRRAVTIRRLGANASEVVPMRSTDAQDLNLYATASESVRDGARMESVRHDK